MLFGLTPSYEQEGVFIACLTPVQPSGLGYGIWGK